MIAELQTVYTIGVYGFSEDAFFGALIDNEIDLFLDVRARRGVRGAKYKFVNSTYLQVKLMQLGIAYAHLPDMAPSREIRAAQQLVDRQTKTAKRVRTALSKDFIKAYRRDVLKVYKRKAEHRFDASAMLQRARDLSALPHSRALRRVALLCVEREPAACHRSLLADELCKQLDVNVEHLLPKGSQL